MRGIISVYIAQSLIVVCALKIKADLDFEVAESVCREWVFVSLDRVRPASAFQQETELHKTSYPVPDKRFAE